MKSKLARILILSLAIAAYLAVATLALAEEAAKKPTYVGSDKCKICHKGVKHGEVYEKWLGSKHSKALEALKSYKGEDHTADAKCLKCHTVGYGKGGFDAMTEFQGVEQLGAVGCEACHGPGSDYKSAATMKDKTKAIAAGLILPKEENCKVCHNAESPTSDKDKPFKFDEMFAKIKHTVPDSLRSK